MTTLESAFASMQAILQKSDDIQFGCGVFSEKPGEQTCEAYFEWVPKEAALKPNRFTYGVATTLDAAVMKACVEAYLYLATHRKRPAVVPDETSAFDANRIYGEAYGVDWVYGTER